MRIELVDGSLLATGTLVNIAEVSLTPSRLLIVLVVAIRGVAPLLFCVLARLWPGFVTKLKSRVKSTMQKDIREIHETKHASKD